MDRARISAIAHTDHPVMAPVSDDAVERLLSALPVPKGGTVADVGCGQGVWLIRLLGLRRDLTGTGIDVSAPALQQALTGTAEARIGDRAHWQHGDATAERPAPADAALCVGSTHVFGGLAGTLVALRRRVGTGGSLLLGEGFWEQPPTDRAAEVIGDLPDLADVVATCHDHGWAIVAAHVSTAEEWDRYEWSWIGSLTRWALDHRDDRDADEVLAVAREHLDEWLRGYRGRLGFVTLVLRDAGD